MGDAKLIRRFCCTPLNGIENQLEKVMTITSVNL
jgi:hypothetical protein